MNIKKKVEEIFEENGIDIYDPDSMDNIDSIQYVTIIVEIEQTFNITLPDYFLSDNSLLDYKKLINVVTTLCEKKPEISSEQTETAMLSKNLNGI